MPGRQEVRRHLRLANGFLATAVIRDDSSEFEIRNALSRSYYALFHVAHAWLAMKNVPLSRRDTHEKLIQEIRSKRGREFGDRMEESWKLRKSTDYDKPAFFEGWGGNLEGRRVSAAEDCRRMAKEFNSYVSELGGLLKVRQ